MAIASKNKQIYDQLMESAKKIGQIAEFEAYEADENATISPNVIRVMIEEGINKLILPKEYGGPQIDFKTFSDMVKTVGYYNLSAAWLTYFFSVHNAWVAFLPKHRMDEIVYDGGLVADIFAPVGKIEKCDGGFIISGTWNYVSGINYSEWISVGARYQFDDEDEPESLGLCMNTSELNVTKDWDSLGLRGTGSHTVSIENVFVPDDMVIRFSKVAQNRKPFKLEVDEDYLYYNVPFYNAFYMGFASMCLGAAQRVLDEFKVCTANRVRASGIEEHKKSRSQRILAKLTLKHKASEAMMNEYINMLNEDEGQYDPSICHALRVQIIRNCVDISVEITLSLGASALKRGKPVEMMMRDLIAIGTHVTSLYEDGIEAFGKYLFGFKSYSRE
ncbi:flavin-dependent monooxygenase [Rummeliibacillus sp. NPDC094406]|uniref:flavin-dependent monooxygenase n=1 Tax=Rummeliibacillus sp. NPDC094406 TaxID=3364511 RepID=UPI003810E217